MGKGDCKRRTLFSIRALDHAPDRPVLIKAVAVFNSEGLVVVVMFVRSTGEYGQGMFAKLLFSAMHFFADLLRGQCIGRVH